MKLIFLIVIFFCGMLSAQVKSGLDMLAADDFKALIGKNIALVTNHTAVDSKGRHITAIFSGTDKFKLVKIFAPEHGFTGLEDRENIADGKDALTGIPVISLYGKNKKPQKEDLDGVDIIVFDIQDIGARYYTYISTLAYAMQAAKENGKKIIVLDRPNPVGGVIVSGFVAEQPLCGKFACIYPIPTRHGMTIGELAQLFNKEFGIGAELEVIKMKGWKREMLFDATGMKWINPSPNIRNLDEAIIYSAIGWLESSNLSVGRGTDSPFEIYGAPFVDGEKLAEKLKNYAKDMTIKPVKFTPLDKAHKHYNKECGGIKIGFADKNKFDPFAFGLALTQALLELYPADFKIANDLRFAIGNTEAEKMIKEKVPPEKIVEKSRLQVNDFLKIRAKYLLY